MLWNRMKKDYYGLLIFFPFTPKDNPQTQHDVLIVPACLRWTGGLQAETLCWGAVCNRCPPARPGPTGWVSPRSVLVASAFIVKYLRVFI